MAAKKNEEIRNDDRVEIMVPRGSEREDPNVQIAVNGKTWLLPRGKKSLVPHEVAEEYERSLRASDAWHTMRGDLQKASKTPEG